MMSEMDIRAKRHAIRGFLEHAERDLEKAELDGNKENVATYTFLVTEYQQMLEEFDEYYDIAVMRKPFDTEVAKLGDFILTHTDYPDGDGFNKNWYEIFLEIDDGYISVHTIPGFTYSSAGVREYFTNYVNKLHNKETENTI